MESKNVKTKRRWQDLNTTQQAAIIGLGAVQISLAVAAWTDLARRPAEQVTGNKAAWPRRRTGLTPEAKLCVNAIRAVIHH